jgi:hypothetical protein
MMSARVVTRAEGTCDVVPHARRMIQTCSLGHMSSRVYRSPSTKCNCSFPFSCTLTDEFRKLGAAKFFLGMEIARDRERRVVALSQRAYVETVSEKTNMTKVIPKSIPMQSGLILSKQGDDVYDLPGRYAEVVGMLLYLVCCTRPDIAFAVGMLARFMAQRQKAHWDAARWVLRYLRQTSGFALKHCGTTGVELEGYSDANFAADPDYNAHCIFLQVIILTTARALAAMSSSWPEAL